MITLPKGVVVSAYDEDGSYVGYVHSKYTCHYEHHEVCAHLSWVAQFNNQHEKSDRVRPEAFSILRNKVHCYELREPITAVIMTHNTDGYVHSIYASIKWFMFNRSDTADAD